MFDEQPAGDPLGECAAEIHRLRLALEEVRAELRRVDATPARVETALSLIQIALAPYGVAGECGKEEKRG